MITVVLQPSYLPWRGVFDLIRRAETFVFYDDVQFDKHGWRNRNRIKTSSGPQWLTVPVISRGNTEHAIQIKDIAVDNRGDWKRKHLESIRHAYRHAPYFEETFDLVRRALRSDTCDDHLAELAIFSTQYIADHLGLRPRWLRSSELGTTGSKLDKLLAVLKTVGATHYISGPSAQAYIDPTRFRDEGIRLEYIDYAYEEYPQLHGAFEPSVSIVDLLMMTGPRARTLITPYTGRQA